MTKHVLFLVHGIGRRAESPVGEVPSADWAQKVVAILNDAAAAYDRISMDELVTVPVLYDDVFYTYTDNWDALADRLAGSPVDGLTNWMKGANEKNFYWDNLADIIMYVAFPSIRGNVVTAVAAQFAQKIKEYGVDAQYSILSHSLGTAVSHDVVQKLSTTPIDNNTSLMPPHFRFRNMITLANVSRLIRILDSDFYRNTRVRPFDSDLPSDKCAVHQYINFRHVADPVPSVVRFEPVDWNPGYYKSLELRHIRNMNIHGFEHYLMNPRVSDLVLESLFGQEIVDQRVRKERIQSYADYQGPTAAQQKAAVQVIQDLLDAIAQRHPSEVDDAVVQIAAMLTENQTTLREILPH